MVLLSFYKSIPVFVLKYQNHEDVSEELKMKSFLEMVNGSQTVAIPFNYGSMSSLHHLLLGSQMPAALGQRGDSFSCSLH